jgi:ABC-2 type transport system ATP-binding protein
MDCLRTFNLTDRKNQLAGGLSGGWKQRLALAGCLLHDPKLLLLDEPTAGVDPKARREFWDEIHKLASQGITTLVSTHYMDEAERCTKLAYIAYGHLLAEGTMQKIIRDSKLHTWAIMGDHLSVLAAQLKTLPGIEQVAFFGNQLHVSGQHEEELYQSIASLKKEDYISKKIQPSLEDVFINLVDKTKEKK